MQETQVRSLGQEDHLKESTATHSSVLAWRIPRIEVLGGLQSMGLQRVGHDSIHTFIHSFTPSVFLLRTCCMASPVLITGNTALTKTDKNPCLLELILLKETEKR